MLCNCSKVMFCKVGMQQNLILEPEPWGLPLSDILMPQHLSALGYKSHAVGKWHLGFFRKAYTPTARGFSSHFGFWNGYQDYYSHTVQASVRTRPCLPNPFHVTNAISRSLML
jgi:arylsulfatase A-like enzyme